VARLAINGYGRIGRCVLRALYERGLQDRLRVVAINEPGDLATVAHLTKYDSTHGRFPGTVEVRGDALQVNGDTIAVSQLESPAELPWARHQVDLVLECSGRYSDIDTLAGHLRAGAGRMLLSNPGADELPAVVYGVNNELLAGDARIISAASCTTNSSVPVIRVLNDAFGIEHGMITTLHSAMNDQPVLDAYHHTDLRKTRAAFGSIIPIETGLAAGIGRILPEMAGRFAARAVRVPTLNVSAIELSVILARPVSEREANAVLERAATGELAGVLGYTDEPLASCDFNHDPRSAIVDASQTRASGALLNLLVWFDNEWGYANRMIDVAAEWIGVTERES
jgi:erythrose-4-phosphate dehydrogenase